MYYIIHMSIYIYALILISWHGEEKHINIKKGSLQLQKFYKWEEEKNLLDKSEIKLPH